MSGYMTRFRLVTTLLFIVLLTPVVTAAAPADPGGPSETYSLYLPFVARSHCPDYFDDFSDPASGWPIGDRPDLLYGYLGGEYRVQTRIANYIFVIPAPTCTRQNYAVEADMRWVGEPGSYYGLAFGNIAGTEVTYAFLVNVQQGKYVLYRRDPGAWVQLVGLTDSAAIRPGHETNRLRAVRNGSQITLQVNGATLGTWTDATISGLTGTGLLIYTFGGSPISEARYDNYRVTNISGSGPTQPSSAVGRPAMVGEPAGSAVNDVWRVSPPGELE